jgi:hypothetical protein
MWCEWAPNTKKLQIRVRPFWLHGKWRNAMNKRIVIRPTAKRVGNIELVTLWIMVDGKRTKLYDKRAKVDTQQMYNNRHQMDSNVALITTAIFAVVDKDDTVINSYINS